MPTEVASGWGEQEEDSEDNEKESRSGEDEGEGGNLQQKVIIRMECNMIYHS